MNSIAFFITHLFILESNFVSKLIQSMFFWQVLSGVLALAFVYLFFLGRSQKKKIRAFMERRTTTIIAQKEKIEEQKALLEYEHEKSDELLKDIFPNKIVKVLKNKGKIEPEYYEKASVLFADFVSFSKITPFLTANQLVDTLNVYFKKFDSVITENKMILIKTIGDSYFAVGGVPKKNRKNPIYTVLSGLQMQHEVRKINSTTNLNWQIRVGITTGEIAAGVLDTKRPMFDVWGSSVNVASRLQEAGLPGKVNISESTYRHIYPFFDCEERGEIGTKNVGNIPMYFVKRIKPELSADEEGLIPNSLFWKYVRNLKNTKPDYISLFKDMKLKIRKELPSGIYYHNEKHALNVMNSAEFLGFGEEIYTEEILLLKTAALLHDIGFLEQYENNEKVGAEFAKTTLPNYNFESEQIELVASLILATEPSREPQTLLEEIMKDADLDYLGRNDFTEISNKLMKEYMENGVMKTPLEFHEAQVNFLKTHKFYTDTAKSSRVKKKRENIEIALNLYNSQT